MHCLDDVKPTMKEKVFECELFKYESFYTGGIGRKSLLIFDGPGGPKYSAGKAVWRKATMSSCGRKSFSARPVGLCDCPE